MTPRLLRRWRTAMGWSLTQAAAALGDRSGRLRAMEAGERRIPDRYELECYALASYRIGAAWSSLFFELLAERVHAGETARGPGRPRGTAS